MNMIDTIFGYGKDLNALQMTSRGILVFLIALVLLRITGRRSFGMRMPLDNIIVILLGAVLSRAVVGASPFVPVIVCSLAVALLHRSFAWLTAHSPMFSRLVQGNEILLYDNNEFIKDNMDEALVSKRDLEQAIRNKAATENYQMITKMYMERTGEISVVKKESK